MSVLMKQYQVVQLEAEYLRNRNNCRAVGSHGLVSQDSRVWNKRSPWNKRIFKSEFYFIFHQSRYCGHFPFFSQKLIKIAPKLFPDSRVSLDMDFLVHGRAQNVYIFSYNLFVTSKNEATNSPIHELKVLQNDFQSL